MSFRAQWRYDEGDAWQPIGKYATKAAARDACRLAYNAIRSCQQTRIVDTFWAWNEDDPRGLTERHNTPPPQTIAISR